MSNAERISDILIPVSEALERIIVRFEGVESPDDFVSAERGREKLDAICMQPMAVGEAIKRLDRLTGHTLMIRYPAMDWKGIMGLRDIMAHEYFDVNEELIFQCCRDDVKPLLATVRQMLADLEKDGK